VTFSYSAVDRAVSSLMGVMLPERRVAASGFAWLGAAAGIGPSTWSNQPPDRLVLSALTLPIAAIRNADAENDNASSRKGGRNSHKQAGRAPVAVSLRSVLTIGGPQWVLWVHVLAACIWIGGQIVVAAVLPLLRGTEGLARTIGRRYQVIAWPAFAALAVTGVLNVGNAGLQWSHLLDSAPGRTLAVKLGLVALSGAAAALHAFVQAPRGRSAMWSATLGSVSLLAAVVAALYGVVIASA
jgi:uncharacterized membrane protein